MSSSGCYYQLQISSQNNKYLDQILTSARSVSSATSQLTTKLKTKLIPSLLLPKDRRSYYRYYGSLTTPGCQESVIWTVLSDKLTVSPSQVKIYSLCRFLFFVIFFFLLLQLEIFRKVENGVNETLAHNNRPIQSLGSRLVYHNSKGY